MNIFKKIRSWFYGTKLGLRKTIRRLSSDVRELGEGIEKLEQDLWKERQFKEDYRDRLTGYYDECIELRKKAKKYDRLLKRCGRFRYYYGRSCSAYVAESKKGNKIKI